jgi:transcriptional regulator with XRE-family HTH domain
LANILHHWIDSYRVPTNDAQPDSWAEFMRTLGRNVSRARESAGLSQERAAAIAGLSKYGLGLLEQGVQRPDSPANPKLRTLVALSHTLGVDLSDLIPANSPDITVGR